MADDDPWCIPANGIDTQDGARCLRGRTSEDRGMPAPTRPPAQPRNPLHGLSLETMVSGLVEHYGWPGLGERIPVRCFLVDPSLGSSLAFLRRTPWAREKVEGLYLFMLRELRRNA